MTDEPERPIPRFAVETAVAAVDVLPWPTETPIADHMDAEGIEP